MEEKARSYQVKWSWNAGRSLDNVADYIALDSKFYAKKVHLEIMELGNSLSLRPYRFEECAQLPTKNHVYRKATYAGVYKIIYKIVLDEIWILDVFHGKLNPKKLKK